MELTSTIHCPICGFEKTEVLPTTTCQIVYTCARCHETLRPKRGDCCVLFLWLGGVPIETAGARGSR